MFIRGVILAGLAVGAADLASASRLNDASVAGMRKLIDLVAPSGEAVGETRFGELASGQVIELPFVGDRTVEYYVNAICDDDCVNVDLAILDAAGVELDTDDADDNAPVLNIQADEYRSATDAPKGIPRPMTIEVRMKDCKADACGYALKITATE